MHVQVLYLPFRIRLLELDPGMNKPCLCLLLFPLFPLNPYGVESKVGKRGQKIDGDRDLNPAAFALKKQYTTTL